MVQRKAIPWSLTENGFRASYFAAGFASLAAVAGNFLPHTLFVNYYKDFVHLYKNGMTVPLIPRLHERFKKAVNLLQVPEDEKQLYTPFAAYGFDVFSAGAGFSKFGIVVGLPANFAYNSVEDIDLNSIKLKAESIIWDSDAGERLQNALVLSEEAQLYAIAREIKLRQTPKFWIDVFLGSVSCLAAYGAARHLNKKFDMYVKPMSMRLVMYGLVGTFVLLNYTMAKDLSQIHYEEKVDEELVQTNPVFVTGGYEFYSQILQRNIALRKLLGADGESMYTVLGNENHLFRTMHTPIVQRMQFFKQALNIL